MTKDVLDRMLSQDQRMITFHAELPRGKQLYPEEFSGREAISELFQFEVQLLSNAEEIKLKTLISKPASLGIALADGSTRHIHGYVADFAALGGRDRLHHYAITLVPWLWLLGQRTDSRIYQELTTEEIVRQVFSRHPTIAAYEFRLREPLEPIGYCTQYQETDLKFVLRMLERDGLFFTFEHSAEGHRMIISDDSRSLAPLERQPVIRYHHAAATEADDSITQWSEARFFQPNRLTIQSFDYKDPRHPGNVAMRSINEQGDVGQHEVFHYVGAYGFSQIHAGERMARQRLEAVEVQAKTFGGESNCRAMEPGCFFELTEHPSHKGRPLEDREFLLLSVEHWGRNNYLGGEEARYGNRFTCMRRRVVYRPGLRTPQPIVSGPQTAIVVGPPGEEIYTDEMGRVKLQFHWDRYGKFDDSSSCWVRVAHSAASAGFGSIQLPRVGDEVLVYFLEGNPDRPMVMGGAYNSVNTPPWQLPANKTQSGVKTRSMKGSFGNANFLCFEDKAGAEQIIVHAERNMDTEVEADASLAVGGNRRIRVEGSQLESIKGDGRIIVEEGEYQITVDRGCVKIQAETSITLQVGESKLEMHADGTVLVSGALVDVLGMDAIHLNS